MLFVSVLCELGNRLLSVMLFRQSSGDGRSLCSGRSMPLVVCLLVYSVLIILRDIMLSNRYKH